MSCVRRISLDSPQPQLRFWPLCLTTLRYNACETWEQFSTFFRRNENAIQPEDDLRWIKCIFIAIPVACHCPRIEAITTAFKVRRIIVALYARPWQFQSHSKIKCFPRLYWIFYLRFMTRRRQKRSQWPFGCKLISLDEDAALRSYDQCAVRLIHFETVWISMISRKMQNAEIGSSCNGYC